MVKIRNVDKKIDAFFAFTNGPLGVVLAVCCFGAYLYRRRAGQRNP